MEPAPAFARAQRSKSSAMVFAGTEFDGSLGAAGDFLQFTEKKGRELACRGQFPILPRTGLEMVPETL